MGQILYSIIIPHKDIPQLLVRCLDSIPSNDNIKVIVVDDASSDDNVEKLRTLSCNYPTFEFFFDKEGGGAGHARNIGLTKAVGDWVIFADADDFFSDNFGNFLEKFSNNRSDIVFFKVNGLYSNTLLPSRRGEGHNRCVTDFLNKKENSEINLRYKSLVPWGKIIRRSLLVENNISFEEIIASNDVMFSTRIGFFAKNIEAVDIVLYNVVLRENSLISTKSLKNSRCRYITSLRRREYLLDHSINVEEISFVFYLLKSLSFGVNEFVWYIRQLPLYRIKFWEALRSALKSKLSNSVIRRV